jgi:hypothetical protein
MGGVMTPSSNRQFESELPWVSALGLSQGGFKTTYKQVVSTKLIRTINLFDTVVRQLANPR